MMAALIGKFAIAGAFGIIYLYAVELFPTQIRYVTPQIPIECYNYSVIHHAHYA